MYRSQFHVADMDCPSEEQLIRTALAPHEGVEKVEVDIAARSLTVWHRGDLAPLRARLDALGLGVSHLDTIEQDAPETDVPAQADQSRVLRFVLAVNAAMFAVELIAGWLAESTGLLADSLDMLADAAVYGIALWAVSSATRQRTAARVSGWLQLLLAAGVLFEVARRAVSGSAPEAPAMLSIAALALVANVVCLLALARHRQGGAHMQASWIFTSVDVVANAGVIVAGGLVAWSGSRVPDLVIGAIIGAIVLRGALRILGLSRAAAQ